MRLDLRVVEFAPRARGLKSIRVEVCSNEGVCPACAGIEGSLRTVTVQRVVARACVFGSTTVYFVDLLLRFQCTALFVEPKKAVDSPSPGM